MTFLTKSLKKKLLADFNVKYHYEHLSEALYTDGYRIKEIIVEPTDNNVEFTLEE